MEGPAILLASNSKSGQILAWVTLEKSKDVPGLSFLISKAKDLNSSKGPHEFRCP